MTATARSKDRMSILQDLEDESQSLSLVLTRRIGDLQKSLGANPGSDNARDWTSELIRLQDRLREHQAKHAQAAAVAASVRGFLQRLPASAIITDCKLPKIKITKGTTYLDSVNEVRIDIAKLTSERTQVQQAGLPLELMQAQAARWVDECGQRATPRVKSGHFGFDVDFRSETMTRANPSVTEILCWLMPDQMKARLAEECEQVMPTKGIVLTPAEKSKRLDDIAAKLTEAERLEVELILAAADEGQHIPHRPAVSPEALLGIVVNAKGKVAA